MTPGIGALLFALLLGGPSFAWAAQVAPNSGTNERLIVVARSDADYDNLRSEVEKAGGSIVRDIRGARSRTTLDSATSEAAATAMGHRPVTGDPAFSDPGLMWDVQRIHAPAAWRTTTGSPSIKVGVEDTGLDYTHAELASKVVHVQDFTSEENPPICSNVFANPLTGQEPGLNDSDLAKILGGPPDGDFSGHGSWIGGNIAAALDGQGVNGIAPTVELVSLKIAEWCGLAYDSTIMDAFLWAGEHNVDVVSISIGGFLDLTDPSQASAGNEHVRLGTAGVALSHGPGQLPCTPTPSSAVSSVC